MYYCALVLSRRGSGVVGVGLQTCTCAKHEVLVVVAGGVVYYDDRDLFLSVVYAKQTVLGSDIAAALTSAQPQVQQRIKTKN